jgi:hypothetical protein
LNKIQDYIDYNPETGAFQWKVTRNSQVLKGDIAGGINDEGYVKIKIQNKTYSAHRLAFYFMTGNFPPEEVDHINNVRNDNRWSNLRLANDNHNNANKGIQSNNTSSVKGVSWNALQNNWRARIQVNKVPITVGYFTDLEDARIAIEAARKKYHGEFANNG